MTEDWQDPGNKLQAAREAKGLSIADVAHRTRIPGRILEALERDDYSSFPSPTYAKSFLSQYAEFVGVDPSHWLDYFEPAAFTGPDDVLSIIDSPEAPEPRSLPTVNRSSGVMPAFFFMLVLSGVIYAAFVGYKHLEKNDSTGKPDAADKKEETKAATAPPIETATHRNVADPSFSASMPITPTSNEPPAAAPPRARIVAEQ